MNRRQFLKTSTTAIGAFWWVNAVKANEENKNDALSLRMPDEGEPHAQTWMAFVANPSIWSARQISDVKRNLALIANTVAKYEPVSILVNEADWDDAEALLNTTEANFDIRLVPFKTDDLWLRDTGPTFVHDTHGEKVAIDFNFNGWGNKQTHDNDSQVASFIANHTQSILENTSLVLEGGCFEVDGHGTAIMTESCIINDNRNPGWSKVQIESELKALLGLKKIIWLKGIKGKDITDGHTDFYARFVRPGEVIVSRDNYRDSFDYEITRNNILTLQNSTDAFGRQLKLHIVDAPDRINESYGVSDFAAGYIGYYLCNGAVIAQKFGDKKADKRAKQLLQSLFPDRVVEQLSIDAIASGGGSIHCATQQEIYV